MEELITQIMEKIEKKKVQSFCRKILKRCRFTRQEDRDNVLILAVWLYIYGYYKESVEVCEILENLEFEGYSQWDQTDDALCLKARILRETNDSSDVRKEVIRRVNEHRVPELYSNSVDYYRETLNINIEAEDADNPKRIQDFWRINKLLYAIKYREAGGHPIPDEEFDRDVEEIVSKLQQVK